MSNFITWKTSIVIIGLLSVIAGVVVRHEKRVEQKQEQVRSFRRAMKNNAQDYREAAEKADVAGALQH